MTTNVRPSWMTGLLAVWLSCGCNALLGIESVQPPRDAGATNDAASAGSAAAGGGGKAGHAGSAEHADSGASGDSGAAADGGMASDAGEAMDSGQAGQSGDSGQAGSGGQAGGAGNAAGAGGKTNSSTDDVHGKIIDFLRHTIPSVVVQIGDQTANSDSSGAFTIANVPATYDVKLTIHTSVQNSASTQIWLFQGLTRRDPTLQVYRGLQDRFGAAMLHVSKPAFPLGSMQKIVMSWGGADGDFTTELDAMDLEYLSPRWIGSSVAQGTAHALLFSYSDPQTLPTEYLAHDAHALTLNEDASMEGTVTFDLSGTKPSTSIISGTVNGSTGNTRSNEVYVRFTDTTAIQVVSDAAAATNFSYSVPSLSNAAIVVVARNDLSSGGYAAAFADNLSPTQSGVTLSIPTIPTPTAPANDKTNVDMTTPFQWSGDGKVFLFRAAAVDTYDALYVVTTQKQAHLPAETPSAMAAYDWSVETHGEITSVDQAADDTGFLSTYSVGYIKGPRRGSGTYSESSSSRFTSAP